MEYFSLLILKLLHIKDSTLFTFPNNQRYQLFIKKLNVTADHIESISSII